VLFSADALGWITPPDTRWIPLPVPRVDLSNESYAPLRPAFIGYLALAAVVALAFTPVPARRPLLVTAAVLEVLSLGPALRIAGHPVFAGPDGAPLGWLPFRLFFLVPGLGGLRAPSRVNYALIAVLAAVVAVVLNRAFDRFPRPGGRAAIVALASLAVLLSVNLPVSTSDLVLTPDIRSGLERVAARSGTMGDGHRDGLLIVPWGCRVDDPRIIALQSVHRRPSIGCSGSTKSIRWFSDLEPWVDSPGLAALRCDPSLIDRRPVPYTDAVRLDEAGVTRLRADLGVRFVVVERGRIPDTGCPSVRAAVPVLMRYENIGDDGNWVIFDLAHPAT
jgi:hypothetical protein